MQRRLPVIWAGYRLGHIVFLLCRYFRCRKKCFESRTAGSETILGALTKGAVTDPAWANIAVERDVPASDRLHIQLEIVSFREDFYAQKIGTSAAGIKIKGFPG